MSRLSRKNRTDIEYKSGKLGINDVFDDMIKSGCRIDDKQYDYICEHLTEEDSNIFLSGELNFSEKRKFLNILDKLLLEYDTNKI